MREPSSWWQKPGAMAALLSPLAALYNAVAMRRLHQLGARLPVPVICIGNPTTGGAGKTPTAIAIARMLRAEGCTPAFLSRGYGGRLAGPVLVTPTHDAGAVGDEPLLLARVALTVVARARAAGATLAIERGADVLVMDDGFQNPAIAKDFSILVVDGRRGVGNGCVFPAGPLRTDLDAQICLAQALLVIGEESEFTAPVLTAADRHGRPIWRGRLVPDAQTLAALAGRRVLAFAGIGSPDKFFVTLAEAGVMVALRMGFDDHHLYTPEEAANLVKLAELEGLDLVTTEKDHARLSASPALSELAGRTKVLPVVLEFAEAAAVRQALRAVIHRATAASSRDAGAASPLRD